MAGSRESATHGGSRAQKRMSEEEDDEEGADGGGRRDGGAKSDGQQGSHESQTLEGKLEKILQKMDRFSETMNLQGGLLYILWKIDKTFIFKAHLAQLITANMFNILRELAQHFP